MDFASDNSSGASAPVLQAVLAANSGYAAPYGVDDWTRAAERRLAEVFERDCTVFLVATGTASNALALAALTPPWGAVFCHHDAHVMGDECGAPEFYTAGAKLVGVDGADGKIDPAGLRAALAAFPRGLVKQVQPAALSLSQATESGRLYTPAEIVALTALARDAGVRTHMDGARFANAVAALDVAPADVTWRAGVDVLSLGASKNGTLACEAVVFFDDALAADMAFRRKRAGHTLSKGRFLGAQMCAWLENGHWLDLARHANAQAAALARALTQAGARLPWTREANEVFAILPARADAALQAAGARYYRWNAARLSPEARPRDGEVFVRLVTSFETAPAGVERFADIVSTAGKG